MFPSLQLHLLQSETYFSLEHCAKEMFYLLCLSLDDAEISQKVTTGKLLLMVVKEQAHLLFTFLREDLLKVLKQENKHLIANDDARTSKGYTINLTYVCKQVWYPPVIFLLSASLMGNEFFN